MIKRISNSLSFKLVCFSLILQISTLFFVTYYAYYSSENSGSNDPAEQHDIVVSYFVEYYKLDAARYTAAQGENARRIPKIEYRNFDRQWQHILQNNPNIWYFAESADFKISHGVVPSNLLISKKSMFAKISGDKSIKTPDIDCHLNSRSGDYQYRPYSFFKINCGGDQKMTWALGGVSEDYRSLRIPVWQTVWGSFIDDLGFFYVLLLALVLMMPVVIFILMQPVRRASRVAETFVLGAKQVHLPLKKVPGEIQGFVRAVNEAFERVSESYKRENVFRSAMAHELRTPLTILRARIDEVKDEVLRSELVDDTYAMRDLVDRFLALAETTAQDTNIQKTELANLIQKVLKEFLEAELSLGQKISLQVPKKPIFIYVNPDVFTLALNNILTNAVTHGRSEKPVEVILSEQGLLSIRDYGKGFGQSCSKREVSSNFGLEIVSMPSHGVGLSIIQACADSMGTKLKIESTYAGGSLISLQFD